MISRNDKFKDVLKRTSMSMLSATMMVGTCAAVPVFAYTGDGSNTTESTVQADNDGIATFAAVDDTQDDWLHAKGSKLYDKDGKEVRLTGANWFGFNCTEEVFHGLWTGSLKDNIKGIADHGINLVRVPVSTELLYKWSKGDAKTEVNVNWANNPELVKADGSHMNSMEIFDTAMKLFKENGIKVMVDVHSPDSNNTGHNYDLWYGKAMSDGTEVTTQVWIDSWKWLVNKYKNDDTLLAVDLKNEPHGSAKWDSSTDENNWKYAAEKCANEILDVNPNLLIMVEGIEFYEGKNAWWGGSLTGVKKDPIDLGDRQSQLVYSPHDYGPDVYAQTWFDKDFNEDTLREDYWYDAWGFIQEENIAPLLIGEWGGRLDGGANEKWLNALASYMNEQGINHTFWCLNPNSGDTGGLWKDDNGTWDEAKYAILEKTLWKDTNGKFVSLDHQRDLGVNGTSIGKIAGGNTSNAKPVEPVNPSEPTVPDTPQEPTVPDTPQEPTVPDTPQEPTVPDTPQEPTVPDTPQEPTVPDTPQEPTVPDTPQEPTVPDTPQEPTVPDTPQEPTVPDTPQEPTVPDTPQEPTVPDTPQEPTVPDTPQEPTVPDTPIVTPAGSATWISFKDYYAEILPGSSVQLVATPEGGKAEKLIWESSNPEIATVDENGIVTAGSGKAGGIVTITAKTADGRIKSEANIAVKSTKVENLWLNNYWMAGLKAGDTFQMEAFYTPDIASSEDITWVSSDESIATVDENGKVTALKKGAVKITAVSKDNASVSATAQFVIE